MKGKKEKTPILPPCGASPHPELCSKSGETTVQVREQTFAIAAGDIAGDVTFCVRPGAFDPEEDRNRITGRVLDSEFLGETTRVRLSWADRRLVVSLPDPPEQETLTVGFDPDDAWVLD